MDEAERLADHVVVVDHGRVVADGSPDELLRRRTGERLRFGGPAGLDLAALSRGARRRASRCGESPGPLPRQRRPAAPLGPAGRRHGDRLVRRARASCPRGSALGRRTLEDVFLDLTGRDLR